MYLQTLLAIYYNLHIKVNLPLLLLLFDNNIHSTILFFKNLIVTRGRERDSQSETPLVHLTEFLSLSIHFCTKKQHELINDDIYSTEH